MGQTYDYYYVGDRSLLDGDVGRSQPTLIAFSKKKNSPDEKVAPHIHSYTELFYFESGSGTFEYDGGKTTIHPHDVVLVNSNTLHRQYSDNSTPLTYYCFAIDDISIPGNPQNCISDKPFHIFSAKEQDNCFYNNINALITEFHSRKFGWFNKAYCLFNQILIDAMRAFHTDYPTREQNDSIKSDYADKIKDYLVTNYSKPINLDTLTSLSLVSKSHMLRLFKNKFGIPPMQYLNLIRLEQAKTLLGKTSLNVTEIAVKVGFDNPVYFTEMFSKYLGVSPSVYRKTVKRRNI